MRLAILILSLGALGCGASSGSTVVNATPRDESYTRPVDTPDETDSEKESAPSPASESE